MKSTNKNTGVAITPAAAHNTVARHQPKPSKAEVIEALVQRAYEAAKVEHEIYQVKYDALTAKIEMEANRVLRADLHQLKAEVSAYHNGQVNVLFKILDPKIVGLVVQRNNLVRPRWDAKEAREKIKHNLLVKRPNGLLEDPEACKAMDAMLASWGM